MKKPIDDPAFWRERLQRAQRESPVNWHKALYDISDTVWADIQDTHQAILSRLFHPYQVSSVLDAGCGFGVLLPILPTNIRYTGVDLSPDFIALAKKLHPGREFFVGNLRKLPFKGRQFDACVCRSMRGMVIESMGQSVWREMEAELLRVADRLILLEYDPPDLYRVHDATLDPKQFISSVVEADGGRLVYRPGQDGTIELYDLVVSEPNRRRGVASRLVQSVLDEAAITGGAVYGFTQINNEPVHGLYRKMGFQLTRVPGFYRGVDAYMFSRTCLPGDRKG